MILFIIHNIRKFDFSRLLDMSRDINILTIKGGVLYNSIFFIFIMQTI